MTVVSERLGNWEAGSLRCIQPGSPDVAGRCGPAPSTPRLQAVADAGGSPWQPRRASPGAVTLELTASELFSAVINIAQNKWDWRELGPELLASVEFGVARALRSAETHNRNGQALAGFCEEIYEMIIAANRYRLSSGRQSRNLPSRWESGS